MSVSVSSIWLQSGWMTKQRSRSAPLSALYVSPLTQLCWLPPWTCCQALFTPHSFVPPLNIISVLALPSTQKGEGSRFSWTGITALVKRYTSTVSTFLIPWHILHTGQSRRKTLWQGPPSPGYRSVWVCAHMRMQNCICESDTDTRNYPFSPLCHCCWPTEPERLETAAL